MKVDLTGRRFGHLVVVGVGERNNKGRFRWKCRCDCGRETNVYAFALNSGKTQSCGSCLTRSGRPLDITGMKFGRLTALYIVENEKKDTYWRCRCDCGNIIDVPSGSLRSGNTKSCGCLFKEWCIKMDRSKISHKKHGGTDKYGKAERLYTVWRGMKRRCNNPNSKSYKYYGGRGIKVCDEWNNDYAVFREWALANGYKSNAKHGECTLDRIDNNGNYDPSNCRFVPMSIQNTNKRKRGTALLNCECMPNINENN